MKIFFTVIFLILLVFMPVMAQEKDEKAEQILKKAIEKVGGEKYVKMKTSIGQGNFSQFKEGVVFSFSRFLDYIVYPDKERTEFKERGIKTIQTNFGNQGWVFDGSSQILSDQSKESVESFKQGMQRSLDSLLRENWRKEGGKISYVGRRPASLGKRNEVIKLIFENGMVIEFEFAADTGFPVKSIYKFEKDGQNITEENRYAQFVEIQGIYFPFVIDQFINGMQTSRINYESIEFNKPISDSIFTKPTDVKKLK